MIYICSKKITDETVKQLTERPIIGNIDLVITAICDRAKPGTAWSASQALRDRRLCGGQNFSLCINN